MYKQISLAVFAVILFIGTTQGARIPYQNDDELYQLLNRNRRDFDDEQQQFQQQMLEAHNKYRSHHCVSSLQLDDDLSRSAQKYAEHLADIGELVHSGTENTGENLWMMGSSAALGNINGE
jgi:uncharacterized protein YkwD